MKTYISIFIIIFVLLMSSCDITEKIVEINNPSPTVKEDSNDAYHEFAEMLEELTNMPGVGNVDFKIAGCYIIEIILTKDADKVDIKELFECVQWGISYRSGDRYVWERRLPHRELQDTQLRIYYAAGDIAYECLGSHTSHYTGEYDELDYFWYAIIWPEMEAAFSFLFPQPRQSVNNNTNEENKEEPLSINGIKIFNSEEDLVFLVEDKGFGPFSHIQEVHVAIGQPLKIKAKYSPTLNDEPYQDNLIYAEYDFCSILYAHYVAFGITIQKPGYELMRGISIGDRYEKIISAFPRQTDLSNDSEIFVSLYETDEYFITGYMHSSYGENVYITYTEGALCIDFAIEEGVLARFYTGYILW